MENVLPPEISWLATPSSQVIDWLKPLHLITRQDYAVGARLREILSDSEKTRVVTIDILFHSVTRINHLPQIGFRGKHHVSDLSIREEQILLLLSEGYPNKQIADKLELSISTVCSHLKHVYDKLHVRSRAEAVARYMASKTPL